MRGTQRKNNVTQKLEGVPRFSKVGWYASHHGSDRVIDACIACEAIASTASHATNYAVDLYSARMTRVHESITASRLPPTPSVRRDVRT